MVIDHEMTQGDSLALDFGIVDADGDPIDLTGATIRWWMARSVYATPILQKSVGSGIAVISLPAGTFTVTLDPQDTADLVGAFYFELEIMDGSGNVSTARTGRISIVPGLIR